MEMEDDFLAYFRERKEKAALLYSSTGKIYNPYFKQDIVFNSDGFHHLQFSARKERGKREQLLKLSLLPLAIDIIRKSGTVQEYRKTLSPIGNKSKRDGSTPMKHIEYWAFIAITGKEKDLKIRVILRKIGDGNIIFWSVMPDSKIRRDYEQKIHLDGIEDD